MKKTDAELAREWAEHYKYEWNDELLDLLRRLAAQSEALRELVEKLDKYDSNYPVAGDWWEHVNDARNKAKEALDGE